MIAKGLRIGNYIYTDKLVATVVMIDAHRDGWIQVQQPDGTEKKRKPDSATIEPIPLTAEILCDCCGFKNDNMLPVVIDEETYYLHQHEGHIILRNEHRKPVIHFWRVKYLHQLQNMYYGLTRRDMKVRFINIK